jgi:hypothetical protein
MGGGESVVSAALSLVSYTLRYVRLEDLVRHGESVDSETVSLMSYTLRYVSLADLVGLWKNENLLLNEETRDKEKTYI